MTNPLQVVADKILGAVEQAGYELQIKMMLDAYRKECGQVHETAPQKKASGRAILEADPSLQIAILHKLMNVSYRDWRLDPIKDRLLSLPLPLTTEDVELLVERAAQSKTYSPGDALPLLGRFQAQGHPLTPRMRAAAALLVEPLKGYSDTQSRKLLLRYRELLEGAGFSMPTEGETWADAALSDVSSLSEGEQIAWKRLFAQAQASETGKPSAQWRKEAKARIAEVGEEKFRASVVGWFASVTAPPVKTHRHTYSDGTFYETPLSGGSDLNISLLKGLAWMCADFSETEVARALSKLIEGGLKKLPGLGPWAVRAVNAAIWALTEMNTPDAVAELSRLKTKVTFRTALNQIEKGLEAAAKRAGVTKADLEDLGVPAYGFDLTGTRREAFGEAAGAATLTPTGEITLEWFGANGQPVKAPPADVKKNYAAELKAFKADVDAAGKMLTSQKVRFDGFYLPERVWNLLGWRERFEAHPLLANLAHRLIWHFSEGDRKAQGLWSGEQNQFVGSDGTAILWLTDAAEVRLWHPIGFPVETVLAWREALQARGIVQPFKQAYREVYLLTEAELRTETYSNRFAGHLLKQHQMNSLAALRGWKNKLRLLVDDEYPPAVKELPELGLRAEFWIEGAGDDYAHDTTESGAYLYLATDQVRFYRMDAAENHAHASGGGYSSGWGADAQPSASLPLGEVPALVFSEILRDVDLFVGVCSVGNDPTWQDGGPRGVYRDYWTDYSFGDLSATARTRREVLQRLLPRLKNADRLSLTEKFLVVRGDLRTYKIHLGSGNILMEPNDQYLCIVQDRRAGKSEAQAGFLPFEGDNRLALILSKALLLAEDRKITDVTITRQIKP